jgi:hypothetical protein
MASQESYPKRITEKTEKAPTRLGLPEQGPTLDLIIGSYVLKNRFYDNRREEVSGVSRQAGLRVMRLKGVANEKKAISSRDLRSSSSVSTSTRSSDLGS